MFKLINFSRTLYEASRPNVWRKASKKIKQLTKKCEICGVKKHLEAHDVIPYRFFKNPHLITFTEWIRNMVVLCRKCHNVFAHCRDSNWLSYNPKIDRIIYYVTYSRKHCTRVNPNV